MDTNEHGSSMIPREQDPISYETIGASMEVLNELGHGFKEKVYENSLMRELTLRGVACAQQVQLPVFYKGELVGDNIVDMIVGGELICELKVVKAIDESHVSQVLNYLKASRKRVGLVLNFAKPRLEWKRVLND